MPTTDKVLSLENLAHRLEDRTQGQRVVLCHGDFEVLHPGYIHYLEEARRMGDVLVVTLTPDRHLPQTFTYPHFDGPQRAQSLAALSMVDFVVVSPHADTAGAIRLLKPDVFVRGDGETSDHGEGQALAEVGARLAVAHAPTPVMSYYNPMSVYPKEVTEFLEDFSSRHSAASITQWLDAGRRLKVLVVGETIIDEYHYVETMGKSGKEPILATRYQRTESFAGGILAVANNVAAFVDQVDMLTVLGRQDGKPDPTEPFIHQHLNPKVRPIFLYQDDAPTIVKRRFVESYPLQKLFEVYLLKHMEEVSPLADELCDKLEAILPDYDVVLVTDYGHGMIVPRAVELLCQKARFLAVNTQTNADNQGFNTISKYRRADFISLSEKELRLEVRSRRRETASIMEEVAGKMGCQTLLVTSGQHGNQLFSRNEGFFRSPSLSNRILDRVGAGDAVFSATTLCVAQGAPVDVVGFIGNIVGAHAVATVGHRTSLDAELLAQHISALLEQGAS
ncbi:bifunctional protein HldE [Geothrix limicola]|uniref:Bifunctional protein HldE n=1 Tax=Geothrix limicola TaxID=2927978 RepID=A0ABQ5QEU1_9BACT|nr:PfkB family carbohydrate kinase [Geothrix limicola]GLH73167.1 bifunctional protein HldE [Geothrix limicola]